MMVRKAKFYFFVCVTSEARFRVFLWINNVFAAASARFDVQTAGAMTHLAAFYFCISHRNCDSFMRRELELLSLLLMTSRTGFHSDILSLFNWFSFLNPLS